MNTSHEISLVAHPVPAVPTVPYGPIPSYGLPAEKELSIKDLLQLLARRRGTVIVTLLFFLTAATLVCVFSTRRYEATAELQVQKETGSPLGLEGGAGEDGSSYSDALQDNITLQTQASILQSDSLALKVIKDLDLRNNSDFRPKFSPIGWALGLISPAGPPDAQLATADDDALGITPRERMRLVGVFEKNLRVKPVAGTRLIDISYLNPDPRTAAAVVNHLAQGLSDYNFQTRHDATAKTAQYLTGQLADVRRQSEELQAKLAQAQRDSGVLSLGGIDAQGREQVYSAVLDKLQQATTAYTQAQSNRIAKGAIYEAAKTGDPEAISGLSGSTMFTGASGADPSLSLIQNLRMQETTLKGELAQASAKFGPAYPKLAEMREQLDTLDASIKTEVQRVAQRARNDYEVAQGVEADTRKVYQDLKRQADAMNDKTIAYSILRQEADESRTLYDAMFKQLKQAGVLADFRLSNIAIVDPARVPARPSKPNVLLYLAAAVAGGLFFGCTGAFLRDSLDNKIQNLGDLELQLGQTPLGVLPFHKQTGSELRERVKTRSLPGSNPIGGHMTLARRSDAVQPELVETLSPAPNLLTELAAGAKVAAWLDPRSPYVESVRALRTSLLLARGGAPPKVILVTSSVPAEGKSMLSSNLAALLVQQRKRVLLVDADLRRPAIHRTLGIPNRDGLSSFLAGQWSGEDATAGIVSIESVAGLYVLTAGPMPPYPAELLGSDQMKRALSAWREHFDFVLIDASPVLPVTDSVILSSMVDFTLLLARYQVTEKQSLERSYRILQSQTGPQKIGVVLNAVRRMSTDYYRYYGYNSSAYYGKEHHA
jgi:capsular exopolysaccharide synthesis family protein